MKKSFIVAISLAFIISCNNHNKENPEVNDVKENKSDSFFPVTSFIKGQIIILDSLPVTPLQITIINNKSDSVWIKKSDIKPLLIPFLTPEITATNLTNYFKETVFNDQTLNAITFTYDAKKSLPDSILIKHWDVYVNPETGSVDKVYIVKKLTENNQIITQQLTWQNNKSAKIVTILINPDGSSKLIKEVVFLWKF